MKKILVLGINSFTGNYFNNMFKDNFHIIGTSRNSDIKDFIFFDAIDTNKISSILNQVKPDVIVNCISDGNVDHCEEHQELATKLNFNLIKDLNEAANEKIKIVHLSTNAIYDGENAKYDENSKKNPINFYGKIKLKADNYLIQNRKNFCILRPITMFGINLPDQRDNPFSFFLKKLIENQTINAVNDIYVNMLDIKYLCTAISKVIQNDLVGEFNISGDDVINRYEFISLIKEKIKSNSLINSVSSSDFPTIAKRPKDTSFNNSKMKKYLKIFPNPITKDIDLLINEINNLR